MREKTMKNNQFQKEGEINEKERQPMKNVLRMKERKTMEIYLQKTKRRIKNLKKNTQKKERKTMQNDLQKKGGKKKPKGEKNHGKLFIKNKEWDKNKNKTPKKRREKPCKMTYRKKEGK